MHTRWCPLKSLTSYTFAVHSRMLPLNTGLLDTFVMNDFDKARLLRITTFFSITECSIPELRYFFFTFFSILECYSPSWPPVIKVPRSKQSFFESCCCPQFPALFDSIVVLEVRNALHTVLIMHLLGLTISCAEPISGWGRTFCELFRSLWNGLHECDREHTYSYHPVLIMMPQLSRHISSFFY